MTTASIAVAVLFWLGGLSRLPSAIHDSSRRPLCVALVSFAAALTLDIPSVYARFDQLVGIPNVADLVEHSLGIIGVFALLRTLEVLLDAGVGKRSRARPALPVVAIVASVTLFFAAGARYEATNFTDRYGSNPYVVAYWTITIAYFGIVLVALGRLVLRHSSRCSRTALRVGLRLVGIGVGVGVLYSAVKSVQLFLSATDSDAHRFADRTSSVTLVIGAVLIGFGLLLPVLESAWTAAAKHLSDRLALLRLRRLWLDVTEDTPEVVLDGRRSLLTDLFTPQPSYRLYRRVIEIRDVQLAAENDEQRRASRGLVEHQDRLVGTSNASTNLTVREELTALLELARVWKPTTDRIST